MSTEIKAPTFPESVADGTIATWHKQPGEAVSRDELIVDIETDKVVLEVVAPADGVIEAILKQEGDIVLSNEDFNGVNRPNTLTHLNQHILAANNILHVGDIDVEAYQNERATLKGPIVEDVGFQFFRLLRVLRTRKRARVQLIKS